MTLPALTLQRPWGWLIMHREKDVENRSWPTKHRGELAIHQGKGVDPDARDFVRPDAESMTVGGILGTVVVVGCHQSDPGCCTSPWAVRRPGMWHWELTDPRALREPVPASGRLGLWPVTGETAMVVRDSFRMANTEPKGAS